MRPKFDLKAKEVSKKKVSLLREAEIATKVGGRVQPASGALDHKKGDVVLEDFLLDSKGTEGTSIIVRGVDLTKISREAEQMGKIPALVLTLDMPRYNEQDWVVLPLSAFEDLFLGDDE